MQLRVVFSICVSLPCRRWLVSVFAGSTAGCATASCDAGGAEETRTPDPLLAKEVLSQLSYGPSGVTRDATACRAEPSGSALEPVWWWAILDSNQRPQSYQDCALTS